VLQNFTINAVDILVIDVYTIILKDVTMTWQKWGSKQTLEKRKTSLSLMAFLTLH
jgi:hypothetical protein